MKNKKRNKTFLFDYFLQLFLFLRGPATAYLFIVLSFSGAAFGIEKNKSSDAKLIEHGFIYAADEGMMKTWWIFSFQNKVYKFEEAKFVDDLSNEKDMKSFNQSKAKEALN